MTKRRRKSYSDVYKPGTGPESIPDYKGVKLTELERECPVMLNKTCKVDRGDDSTLRKFIGDGVVGRFVSERGRFLEFRTQLGYIESFDKWEFIYGTHKVIYKEV